ncbi:unnamed protein product [Dimorphilus gyrociliatus]|uniref:F-box domain-containing protein n=1 Tax=Dimorphilus gyrociliatus TaxID=2664684 RepID=A0A7I8W750_9ANNE|nr:unnamed protein product [Dimorphilus gyrociliatus]
MLSKGNCGGDVGHLRPQDNLSTMKTPLVKRLRLEPFFDWNNLPPEILVKIFRHCVMTEGHLSLARLGAVSENWRKIIPTPSLWNSVDFVKGSENFTSKDLESVTRRLCRYIHNCKKISFNSTLSNIRFDSLLPFLKNVTEISFKGCPKLKPKVLVTLAQSDNANTLDSINIDGTFSYRVYNRHITTFVSNVLPRLRKLNFANNRFDGPALHMLIEGLTDFCPILEELSLENCFCTSDFDLIPRLEYLRMKRKCLALKSLNLNHTNVMFYHYTSSERNAELEQTTNMFDLKEFRMANSNMLQYFETADALTEFIGDMPNLEILELSRLKGNNSFKVLYYYKSNKMKYLYLRESLSGHLINERELSEQAAKIFRRWSSTLIELDLSGNNLYDFSWAVIFKSFGKYSPLTKLNLAKTNVVSAGVEFILRRFKNLRYLNLKLCNHLKEHMKREYHSIDLREARKNLRR